MNNRLRRSIQQILLAGGAATFAVAASGALGPQVPPPDPGQVPDYFGVTPNYATSPQPVFATVSISPPGSALGARQAVAAATTYDYANPNYAINPHGLYPGKVMDVQLVDGGAGYDLVNTPIVSVTVSGGAGSTTTTLTPIIVNGVIAGFNEIPHGDIKSASNAIVSPAWLTNASGQYLIPGTTLAYTGVGSGFTAPLAGTGIRKFVDSVSLPGALNDLGQNLPIATADQATFPGSDYYVIGEVEYIQKMHADLPASHLRGYVQLDASGNQIGTPQYLGPIIIAQKNRPVRIKVVNKLSKSTDTSGLKGALPIPVDHTYMGAEKQDANGLYNGGETDNRTAVHLHGGNTPWISDGTPRQTMKPSGETAPNKGVSASNVPDMWFNSTAVLADGSYPVIASCAGQLACAIAGATNDPGPGALSFFYTNQQSARLMFYHDHAEGITRLNVYDGLAAGYILQDPTEKAMTNGGTVNGVTYSAVLPVDMIPLVIQEKTFVPSNKTPVLNFYGAFKSQLNSQDPTWHWGTGFQYGTAPVTETNGTGDLWVPHVYMTNQNPGDISGANPLGRWDYGSWFWPPFSNIVNKQIVNPYYDPKCNTTTGVGVNAALGTCEGQYIPGFPNGVTDATAKAALATLNPNLSPIQLAALSEPSGTPEAFNDTPTINGTVYPFMQVEPKKYRLRILSVGNDRTLNLSLFVASSNTYDTTSDGNIGATSAAATAAQCDGSNTANDTATTFAPGTTPKCSEVRMVPWNATQNAATKFPATWYTNLKGGITFDGRPGGVPDPQTRGPALVQIGTDGGFLSTPAVISNQPVNFEFNVKNIQVTNVKEHALLLGPAERADVVVDFSQFAGSTLILYNDSPAAIPAYDLRLDYFTGNFDNTDTGGAFSTVPGYGPNSRTLMQFRVNTCGAGTASCGANANLPASRDYVDPDYLTSLTTEVQKAFKNSQEPIIVPQAAYNATYGLPANTISDVIGSNQSRISDTQLSFTPFLDPIAGTFDAPVTLGQEPKAIQELFTADYGRMNATLGTEVPNTTGINQTTIPLGYIDPPTELVEITKDHGASATAVGQLYDGTQLWKITHNGVDTHAMHFHLFHVQIVNRVGWDGAMYPPEPNELGWKDTVRMNPLADVIVALRPKKIQSTADFLALNPSSTEKGLDFKVPNSHHLMDPSQVTGGVLNTSNLDPTTGNASSVTNQMLNYGWEYVWHCHILGHEENDMMRSIAVAQPPEDPTISPLSGPGATASSGAITVNWIDNSVTSNWVTIQRSLDGLTNADGSFLNVNATFNVLEPECAQQTGCVHNYVDNAAPAATSVYYHVLSNSTVGGGDTNGKFVLASQPDLATVAAGILPVSAAGFAGYDNATAYSAWSNTVSRLLIPRAVLSTSPVTSPVVVNFGNQTINVASAAKTVTLSNTGTGALSYTGISITAPYGRATGTNAGTCSTAASATLAAGASCTIGITFTPGTATPYTGSLTVTDNSGNVANSRQSAALSGLGIAPFASVSGSTLTYANQVINTTSSPQTVTLSNTGTGLLTINSIAIANTPGSSGFARRTGATGGTCGITLAAKATCTINVTFTPTSAGAKSGTLTITDNSTNGTTQTVALSGNALAAANSPVASVSTASLTFAAQTRNTTSAAQTVTLSNTGNSALTISGIAIANTPGSSGFVRPAGAGGGTCGATLAAGSNCTINVTFRPTSAGAKSGTLTITDNSLGANNTTQIVSLTGTGL